MLALEFIHESDTVVIHQSSLCVYVSLDQHTEVDYRAGEGSQTPTFLSFSDFTTQSCFFSRMCSPTKVSGWRIKSSRV